MSTAQLPRGAGALAPEETLLIEQGYRGYHIAMHDCRFIAVAVVLAEKGLAGLSAEELSMHESAGAIIIGKSLDEVKRRIEETSPTVLDEDFHGFRLVRFRNRTYGIAHALGDLDLLTLDEDTQSALQRAGTLIVGERQDKERLRVAVTEEHPAPAPGATTPAKEKALALCLAPVEVVRRHINELSREYSLVLLTPPEQKDAWPGLPTLVHHGRAGAPSATLDLHDTAREELAWLKEQEFGTAFVLYDDRMLWGKLCLPERLAAACAKRIVVRFANGEARTYEGEDINRIQYNRAYLDQMFQFVPPLKGRNILEVGCGDGLACDLLLTEQPHAVTGVDVCQGVGARFHDPRLSFAQMDAAHLSFPDDHFDLCYSIAVLEHCPDPHAVLQGMKRVTKPGGFCYVQAGPLYFSPFGHHMFGWFDRYPWIHLRLTPEEIIYGAKADGIADRLKAATGRDIEEYIAAMLNPQHINGKALSEYGLTEFVNTDDIEVLHFAISREGENLLNDGVLQQLAHIGRENLITHGFEMVFRVV